MHRAVCCSHTFYVGLKLQVIEIDNLSAKIEMISILDLIMW